MQSPRTRWSKTATAWLALCLLGGVGAAQADTLYRCKAYTGGTFWSREHCQSRNALVDRIADVPSGMGFAQQVKLAEQGARESAAAAEQATRPSKAQQEADNKQARASARHKARCGRLEADMERQYSRSRQEVTAHQQERITRKKASLREEQERAGC